MKLLKILVALVVVVVAGTFIWLDLSGDGTVKVAIDSGGKSVGQPGKQKNGRPIVADRALLEKGPSGALPKIDAKGRMPWRVYRAKFSSKRKRAPQIAVIITGLGLRAAVTKAAIAKLPPEVTLAFSPYADNLPNLVKAARLAGHEVLLTVPMEPLDYPKNDPGQQTLLTTKTAKQNIDLLRWSMGRFPGYVGIMPYEGGRFLRSRAHLRPVLQEIKERGLMFLDLSLDGTGEAGGLSAQIQVPSARVTGLIDKDPSRETIAARLNGIAAKAKKDGFAVALGRPYPATIEMVATWIATLKDRGFVAVPITVVAERNLGRK